MSAVEATEAAEASADPRQEELLWVRDSLNGDARAFRRIVEAHHRSLYLMAARIIGDRSEAQDLVQESFAKAYVHLDRYDSAYRLSTWLHRITLNTCRDFLKSPRRKERVSGADPLPTQADPEERLDERLDRKRRAARVRAAIESLKPSYREILILKDLQQLSYQRIHEITRDPITALKIRAIRARAKLREALEGPS